MHLTHSSVYCRLTETAYTSEDQKQTSPENDEQNSTVAATALSRLFEDARLDSPNQRTNAWNPLYGLIKHGDRVVIKPNWVSHENLSGQGLECLISHTSLIEAIARFVARAQPSNIIIGDAPVQGCDFDSLIRSSGAQAMQSRLFSDGINHSIRDFRRTEMRKRGLSSVSLPTERREDEYVLFDLGKYSSLEPISGEADKFRVLNYDHRALNETHGPGKHQYLIAREILEADVIINVPKLKTHKKSGITGAIKNVVGINGLKDYLPHHRKGGSETGGDCYEGRSRLKTITEDLLDASNMVKGRLRSQLFGLGTRLGYAVGRAFGNDNNIEGSWYGNDTVWRMTLDLQRILNYGRTDASMAETPQRRIITITDAIVAGEGEGPLASTPKHLGLVTFGLNVCAIEWVHALFMGIDPTKIPVISRSFDVHKYSLADFTPGNIEIYVNGKPTSPPQLIADYSQPFLLPAGWVGACELDSGRFEEC